MKPEWRGTEIRIVNGKAKELSKCHQCQHTCVITTGLNEVLPTECPKDKPEKKGG